MTPWLNWRLRSVDACRAQMCVKAFARTGSNTATAGVDMAATGSPVRVEGWFRQHAALTETRNARGRTQATRLSDNEGQSGYCFGHSFTFLVASANKTVILENGRSSRDHEV